MPKAVSKAVSATKSPAVHATLSLAHARARWHARQGLAAPASPDEPVAALLGRTGWPRTLGGIDVYLSLWARSPGIGRAALDGAVLRSEVQVVPAVRGCIYVVPRAQVPLVLRLAESIWRPRTEREVTKVGAAWSEVTELAEAIAQVLGRGARAQSLTTDALRKALPAGAVRSLGEAGKKVGISSLLPLALRLLEFAGRVERTLEDGRLDSERYLWRTPARDPFASGPGAQVSSDPAERLARLAEIFFAQAAPATAAEFAEWAGISQREARAAAEGAGLLPVRIEGIEGTAWAAEPDLAPPPPSSSVTLLCTQDNYLTLHGGPRALTDAAYHGRTLPVWGGTRGSTLGDAKYVSLRTVLDGDRVVGFWEFEPGSGRIAWRTFEKSPRRDAIAARAEALAAFMRDELGHGRSFNLDTDEQLRQRVGLVEAMSA